MQIAMQQTYATCFFTKPKYSTEQALFIVNKKSGSMQE